MALPQTKEEEASEAGPAMAGDGCLPRTNVATLHGHEGAVMAVCYNAQGDYCISGGADRTVRLWNPSKGLQIKSYTAHAHGVLGVCSSTDNARIASVGGDKQVFLWDVATGRVLRKFRGHMSKINAVAHTNLERATKLLQAVGNR